MTIDYKLPLVICYRNCSMAIKMFLWLVSLFGIAGRKGLPSLVTSAICQRLESALLILLSTILVTTAVVRIVLCFSWLFVRMAQCN